MIIFTKAYYDTNYFTVNKIEFTTNKIPEDQSFTILQISDLHNKEFGNNNKNLINEAAQINPDMIVMTGDFINTKTQDFQSVFHLVEALHAINKNLFFVTGNHDWMNPNLDQFLTGLKERHVTVLDNNNTLITMNRFKINLTGVGDPHTFHDNLQKAFEGVNSNKYYTVLLAHAAYSPLPSYPIPADLILSGHTHGGQIRLPYIGAVAAPGQGLFPKFDKGTFKIDVNTHLYIDSGLGTSVIPVRLLNQSQMTLMTIKNDS